MKNYNLEIHCMKQELFKEKHNRLLCTSPFILWAHLEPVLEFMCNIYFYNIKYVKNSIMLDPVYVA